MGGLLATIQEGAANWARSVSDVLDSAPWLSVAVLAILLVFGLAMWAAGGKLVRPLVLILFAGGGAWAGYAIGGIASPELGPWIGLAAGLVLGAGLGLVIFRLASAVLLAIFLGLAAPTGLAVALDFDLLELPARESAPADEDGLDAGDFLRSLTTREGLADSGDASSPRGLLSAAVDHLADWSEATAGSIGEAVNQEWRDLSARERTALLGVAAIGFGVGLIVGLLKPTLAAGAVTAGFGALALLSAGVALLTELQPGAAAKLPKAGIAWAAIWFGVAAVGTLLQAGPRRKRVKNGGEPAPAAV